MTDFQHVPNDVEELEARMARKRRPNHGLAGATQRSRARGRAFRALNPEIDRLVTALEEAGAIQPDLGELSTQVVTCLVLYLREPIDELAAVIELGILEPAIATNMAWHVGNRKAAWDAKLQSS
jgi:hypothetical protein